MLTILSDFLFLFAVSLFWIMLQRMGFFLFSWELLIFGYTDILIITAVPNKML